MPTTQSYPLYDNLKTYIYNKDIFIYWHLANISTVLKLVTLMCTLYVCILIHVAYMYVELNSILTLVCLFLFEICFNEQVSMSYTCIGIIVLKSEYYE